MITLQDIKRITETELNLTDISIKNAEREYPEARFIYCTIAKELSPTSTYNELTKPINKNYCTAIHAFKRCDELREVDPTFDYKYNKVRDACIDYSRRLDSDLEKFKGALDRLGFEIDTVTDWANVFVVKFDENGKLIKEPFYDDAI